MYVCISHSITWRILITFIITGGAGSHHPRPRTSHWHGIAFNNARTVASTIHNELGDADAPLGRGRRSTATSGTVLHVQAIATWAHFSAAIQSGTFEYCIETKFGHRLDLHWYNVHVCVLIEHTSTAVGGQPLSLWKGTRVKSFSCHWVHAEAHLAHALDFSKVSTFLTGNVTIQFFL